MPPSAPITVALVRFEDLLARGLRQVIDADLNLELVAGDVEADRFEVVLRAHHPRVAIIDADALSALADVAELSRRHPETRLVLFATHPTTAECAQLLAFGASACLSRRAQARDVLSAIHLAARGLQLVPRLDEGATDPPLPGLQRLTRREAEVLPMLQQGSSNAEIAAILNVTVETVRSHARSIYRKLGVSSRRDLAPTFPRAPAEKPEPSSRPAARLTGSSHGRQRRSGAPRR